jgi:hypothetical protein
LIASGPFHEKPDMKAIERVVAAEFARGLLSP